MMENGAPTKEPTAGGSVAIRLLAGVLALCAGIAALIVVITLVHNVLA